MKRFVLILAAVALCVPAFADEGDRGKLGDRLENAGNIMKEIMDAPDKGIPEEILAKAKCIAVVPSLMKAALGLGGQYGQGVVTCRTASGWSAPAFYRVGGGSIGFQIGGQAVDVVMLFMNDRGMNSLLTDKVKLGADASVAAGPVGRHAAADTDATLRAEVLTYSRTRGVFAGVSLNGSWVQQNDGDTRDFYGKRLSFRTILKGGVPAPEAAQPFLNAVRSAVHETKSDEAKK
jgi:lipid-binding SYLF domain-containing protein